ncbi:MAG: SHOCT domain-containing protein [Actinobacteria bacterium]|nr:SHOCT domain-containing protein [Actinomycetota bacterium]
MFMRRRPLVGAAVVGGVAYHAGKKGQQARYAEDEQNQQIADLQQQNAQMQQQLHQQEPAAPAEAPPAAAAPAGGITEQLTQLKGLLDSGVLTQEEFQAAKAKVLAGG